MFSSSCGWRKVFFESQERRKIFFFPQSHQGKRQCCWIYFYSASSIGSINFFIFLPPPSPFSSPSFGVHKLKIQEVVNVKIMPSKKENWDELVEKLFTTITSFSLFLYAITGGGEFVSFDGRETCDFNILQIEKTLKLKSYSKSSKKLEKALS